MSDELLITVEEAAYRLSLSRSMTYLFIRSGQLASVKIRGSRRVPVASLDEFVRSFLE